MRVHGSSPHQLAPRLAALLLCLAVAAPARAVVTAHLTYQGGRVISDVEVIQVNWGTIDTTLDTGLAGFYQAVTDSPYLDWLVEYDTAGLTPGSNQTISRGTFGGRYVITPSITGATVDDTQIQAELAAQIAAGHLPAPKTDGAGNVNSLYMIEFPLGITVTQNGSASCVAFCAYHSTIAVGGLSVPYGVLPFIGSGSTCAGGCGTNPTDFENETMVHAHQLIEAVTDAEVGLNRLAWYDNTNGEIADICDAMPATVAGYTVQQGWSNQQSACVAAPLAPIPICTGSNAPCRRCVLADEGRTGGCTGATPVCQTDPAQATYGQCVAAPSSQTTGSKGGCATADPSAGGGLLAALALALAALRRRLA